MRSSVDHREVDDDGTGQQAKGRVVLSGHHSVAAPQLQGQGGDLGGDRRQIALVGHRAHRLVQGHELLIGDEACPEQLVLQRVARQTTDGPRRAVRDDVHLRVVEAGDHAVQLVLGVRQQRDVVHRILSDRLSRLPGDSLPETTRNQGCATNGRNTPDAVGVRLTR